MDGPGPVAGKGARTIPYAASLKPRLFAARLQGHSRLNPGRHNFT